MTLINDNFLLNNKTAEKLYQQKFMKIKTMTTSHNCGWQETIINGA